MRKGIYQAFDKDQNVIADERWQFITLADGSIQIDNETIRLRPFAEPRRDSITLTLDGELNPQLLTIHALKGKRESRISWVDGAALTCWQFDTTTHRREFAFGAQHELDYISPLFNMVTVWRSRLAVGQSRRFEALLLDAVSFEPTWMTQTYAHVAREPHTTVFGELTLEHYTLDFGGKHISHFWCDDDGVVFDFRAGAGGGYLLRATNF